MGSDRHVAKVDWEEWLAHLPDPIQPAEPLDWEPPALDQGYQQAEQGQMVFIRLAHATAAASELDYLLCREALIYS